MRRLAAPLILAAHTNALLAGPPLKQQTRPCFAPATAPAVDDETDFVSADDLEREAFAEEVVVRSKGPTAATFGRRGEDNTREIAVDVNVQVSKTCNQICQSYQRP